MNTNYLKSFWKIITCEPSLKQNQYEISDFGEVRELACPTKSNTFKFEERFYHSANGYDFVLLNMKNNLPQTICNRCTRRKDIRPDTKRTNRETT